VVRKFGGPSRYDDLAADVLRESAAEGVLLIVFGGRYGSGFAAELPAPILAAAPAILRNAADQIESHLAAEAAILPPSKEDTP
jgi:hypothetical protein